jgi:tetratricopeptide (TPR) repeat protein
MIFVKKPFAARRQYAIVGCQVYLTALVRLTFALCTLACAQHALADTPVQLLRNNSVPELETLLARVQQRFENGELTEIDLRNAFRPFYDLDEISARNLAQWASSSPKSYVAHLALGIYFKRRGTDARGDKYMADTPLSAVDLMSVYFKKATEELRTSLALTRKPYLSTFHLLTISMQFGDRDTSFEMLHRANEILPNNSFVRNRYAVSLTPRWGGSYEQMDKFISDTKAERVPASVVFQLEAIEHDDKGHALEERNQHADAMEHFQKALELATRVEGTFAVDFLNTSRYYGCSGQNVSLSCR